MKIALFIAGLFVGAGLSIAALYLKIPLLRSVQPSVLPDFTNVFSPTPLPEPEISGWFAYWDEISSEESLKESIPLLKTVDPLLYRIAPDGSLDSYMIRNRDRIVALIREYGMPVIPQIGDDFDSERVSLLLRDEEVQEAFINQLITEAEENDYQGWDFDIETLEPEDRDAHSAFITRVAEAFHENDLIFSMTIYAKTHDRTRAASEAQDYEHIGKTADVVKIMAYGYSWDSSDPGPQAPLDWYHDVLDYAAKTIPREKIVVGLSTHGYRWGSTNTGMTYPEIAGLLAETDTEVVYDESASSARAELPNEDVIWFEDARTIREKIIYAQEHFGIHRFNLWRIGAEDPSLWTNI